MTNSLAFTSLSLVYSIFLISIYFKKQRINTYENKIFGKMLIINFIGIIIEIVCNIVVINIDPNSVWSKILSKALLIYLISFVFLFALYVFVIAYNKKNKHFQDFYKKIKYSLIYTYIITIFFSCILPITIHFEGTGAYSDGPATNMVFIASSLCILLCLYVMFNNIKSIKDKKYSPLFAFIVGGTACTIIQKVNPFLTLATPMETFVLLLMYFSIENPDAKLINELNIARDQAEKANNAKTDFLSNMSHEIRTPLNAIVGFSNSLANENLSDAAKEDAKYIISASDNLLELVNGILDISKIEANKIEIVKTEYEISKVLDDLVALTKARLGEKPIEFRTSFDKSMPAYLYGDYTRIKQICVNLLTNSVKYTKEGFIEFKVDYVKKNNICRLIISVEDSGIGIKKDKIDKLFTKFERLDLEKNISIEGTGLGLAITKRLVELMNGKIVVQSDYGKGSKFTVAIDQRIVENPKSIKQRTLYEEQIMDFSNKKVLVVDDNKLNLKVAEKVLEPFKVTVECIDNGQTSIDKINAKEHYDLILMDDMMPHMSGIETLKELKKINGFNTPVVALTANAISGMKEKYLKEGFDDYLAKPIEKEELKRVLNTHIK